VKLKHADIKLGDRSVFAVYVAVWWKRVGFIAATQ